MNEKKHPIAIDVFSGCGGLTAGLKMARFDVVAAIEIDKKARETYSLNHPEVLIAGTDIKDVSVKKLMHQLNIPPGELDLLAGCPPCQGFSSIRRRNKTLPSMDARNDLIDDFARLALGLEPKLIMMENVPGLTQYHKFDSFILKLEKKGYQVTYEVLDISNYGLPQRRHRLILLASKIEKPRLAKPALEKITVRDTIGSLPKAGDSGDAIHDYPEVRSERIKTLISLIPKDGGSRSSLPYEMQLPCHKNNSGFNDVYGRMKWDDLAPTITGGCTNPSKGRFLHPQENRAITLREAALLQGFSKDYKFDITHGKEAISLMIGNALPPPFIKLHAESLLETIK